MNDTTLASLAFRGLSGSVHGPLQRVLGGLTLRNRWRAREYAAARDVFRGSHPPMRVTLADRVAHPVFISGWPDQPPDIRDWRSAIYGLPYMTTWPARFSGGEVRSRLRLAVDGGAPSDYNLTRLGPLVQALKHAETVTVFGLGSATFLDLSSLAHDPTPDAWLVRLIHGIVQAGAPVWLELDDPVLCQEQVPPPRERAARTMLELLSDQDWAPAGGRHLIADLLLDRGNAETEGRLGRFGWTTDTITGLRLGTEVLTEAHSLNDEECWGLVVEAVSAFARVCTGVIVTSELMEAKARALNPRVVLIPYSIDEDELPPVERPSDGIVRVGYGGNTQHTNDMRLLELALAATATLPNVEWHFYCCWPGALDPGGGEGGFHALPTGGGFWAHPKLPWREFHEAIGTLDIALAPLYPAELNRGRSATKIGDNGAYGAAMVLSACEPYTPHIEHGVNGFLAKDADDFTRYVRELIGDEALRRRMGAALHAYWQDHFTLRALEPRWREVLGLGC